MYAGIPWLRQINIATAVLFACFFVVSCDSNEMEYSQGSRLERIERVQNDEVVWQEVYRYNEENQVIEIEQDTEDGFRYIIEYEGGRVLQILHHKKDLNFIVHKDSLVYNASDRIKNHYYVFYSWETGERLSIGQIDYEYSSIGVLERMIHQVRDEREGEPRIEQLFWSADGVRKVAHYRGNQLRFEFFYTYDNKVNVQRLDPRSLTNPVNSGQYNLISSSARDYTGLLDLACNPCEWSYTYNRQGLPVRLIGHFGSELRYWYSEVESDSKCCFNRNQ